MKTTFVPRLFPFDDTNSGIRRNLVHIGDESAEIYCFKLMFDCTTINYIKNETNSFYHFTFENTEQLGDKSKLHKWNDIIVPKIYTYLALVILISHNKKNYLSTDSLIITTNNIWKVYEFG